MNDLLVIENKDYEVPEQKTAISKLNAIMEFQKIVKTQLKKDEDFGTIPSTTKPTLYKSGAEKILSILGISIEIKERKETKELLEIEENKIPYFEFSFIIRGIANNGKAWESTGSCNTLEKKYCKKPVYQNGRKTGESLITDYSNYYGLRNTIEKMAYKRAVVSLSLVCGALSNIFTQDLEDFEQKNKEEKNSQEKSINFQENSEKIKNEKILEIREDIKNKLIAMGVCEEQDRKIEVQKIRDNIKIKKGFDYMTKQEWEKVQNKVNEQKSEFDEKIAQMQKEAPELDF